MMSTWSVGRVYDYYGRQLQCVGRYFEGPLELVALQNSNEPWDGSMPTYRSDLLNVCGMIDGHPAFFRTARALRACVFPRVTETLGGVMNPNFCRHDCCGRVVANAGPNCGRSCCELCGTALGEEGSR